MACWFVCILLNNNHFTISHNIMGQKLGRAPLGDCSVQCGTQQADGLMWRASLTCPRTLMGMTGVLGSAGAVPAVST